MTHHQSRILIASSDAALRQELTAVLEMDGYGICLAPVPLPERLDPVALACDLVLVDHAYACTVGIRNTSGLPIISIGDGTGVALTFDANPLGLCDRLARPIDVAFCLDMVAHHLARTRAAKSSTAKPAAQPLLQARLSELEQLGGSAFVSALVRQFLTDARLLKEELERARERLDIPAFKDHAHALRSCAANVGAQALYELCLSWKDICEADLSAQGDRNLARLQADLAEAEVMFDAYLAMSAELGTELPSPAFSACASAAA